MLFAERGAPVRIVEPRDIGLPIEVHVELAAASPAFIGHVANIGLTVVVGVDRLDLRAPLDTLLPNGLVAAATRGNRGVAPDPVGGTAAGDRAHQEE